VHLNPHWLAAHVGVAPATAVEHTVPHLPQLLGSVAMLTQVVPAHSVGVATGQPDAQA
jgi:hypothetical protein